MRGERAILGGERRSQDHWHVWSYGTVVRDNESGWVADFHGAPEGNVQYAASSESDLPAGLPELEHGLVQDDSGERTVALPISRGSLQCVESPELVREQRLQRDDEYRAEPDEHADVWEGVGEGQREFGAGRAQSATVAAGGVLERYIAALIGVSRYHG